MLDRIMKLYRVGLLRPNHYDPLYREFLEFRMTLEEAVEQVNDIRNALDIHGWEHGTEIRLEVLECSVVQSTSYTG